MNSDRPLFNALLPRYLHDRFLFVQIGAFDGVYGDALYPLVKKYGISGVLVEPLPEPFAALKKNYSDQPQVRFENSAIIPGYASGPVKFMLHKKLPTCSGLALRTDIQRRGERLGRVQEIEVNGLTWNAFRFKHEVYRLDLLQIDAEGFDWEIIKASRFTPEPAVIRFEVKSLSPECLAEAYDILGDRGYKFFQERIDVTAYLPGRMVML